MLRIRSSARDWIDWLWDRPRICSLSHKPNCSRGFFRLLLVILQCLLFYQPGPSVSFWSASIRFLLHTSVFATREAQILGLAKYLTPFVAQCLLREENRPPMFALLSLLSWWGSVYNISFCWHIADSFLNEWGENRRDEIQNIVMGNVLMSSQPRWWPLVLGSVLCHVIRRPRPTSTKQSLWYPMKM